MKKQIITLIAILIVSVSFAQNGFNYKALITNNGNILINTPVDIKFTISNSRPLVIWQEEHTGLTTDSNGIIVAYIGEGTKIGGVATTFADVGFSHSYNLKVEVNINGNGYQLLSDNDLRFVPSAYYAKKAGSVNYSDINNIPADIADGDDDTHLTEAEVDIMVANNGYATQINELSDAITGNDNLFLGELSGSAGTGGYNTGVGKLALSNVGIGHHNVAVGHSALGGSGNFNTVVGAGAMLNSGTGRHNVAIGGVAGFNATGNNNIFIGFQAGFDATGDNQLYIANSDTSTPLIYGNFASSELTVNGSLAIKDGSEGAGKIFTSDANGKGIWQDVSTWDTNASDDFSGNYNDLTNKPDVFHKDDGTSDAATSFTDNIKHAGNIFIGPTSFNVTGVNKSSVRINRRFNDTDSYGLNVAVSGHGSGKHYGAYLSIFTDGTDNNYGAYCKIDGANSGDNYGVYNSITGTGTGKQYGLRSVITNSGDGIHYGAATFLSGSGTGSHYGMSNYLTGSGTGNQYGVYNSITNSGNGAHYGVKSILSGTGTGTKYGIYSNISTIAGGRHYAIYAQATKDAPDIYAGYFVGDVNIKSGNINVENKLTAPQSGDSDMKAYIYGYVVNSGDGIVHSKSSDGFTVTHISTGEYKITFTDTSIQSNQYIVIASSFATTSPEVLTFDVRNGYFYIYSWNISTGNKQNTQFSFVVYKK